MNPRISSAARHLWANWVRPLGLAALVVLPLKSAVADWNWVPSGSMRPTILEGELIVVNKLAYDLKVPFTTRHLAEWSDPRRGEIVVCFSPNGGTRLVKRVVGLPGDRIVVRGAQVWVNGARADYGPIDRRWSDHLTASEHRDAVVAQEALGLVRHPVLVRPEHELYATAQAFVVPAGEYFMMGDNRDLSFDSRYFGSVRRDQIVGRAVAVALSFDPDHALLPRLDRWFGKLM
ncbi:signal peptidase I [Opitutaceae bacterium EW11]|nr:signal peptidase I [Opitutaceae bacterium EW11]